MLRPLGLACLSVSLAACAGLLGDFDVKDSPDAAAGGVDGSTSETSLGDGGGGSDAGAQPEPIEVAVNQAATCATVKYGSTLKSYCWGAANVAVKEYLGVTAADQPSSGFFSPHLPAGPALTFDKLYGTGSGLWFIASGTQAQGATTAFTWGSNLFGQSGQGIAANTGVLPGQLTAMAGGASTKLRAAVAAGGTRHGCVVDDAKLYCWGANDVCQVTGDKTASCLTPGSTQLIAPAEVKPFALGAGGNLTWDRVAVGAGHTCAIARPSGSGNDSKGVYCFGDNTSGQCGVDRTTTAVGAPAAPKGLVVGGLPGSEIAAGDKHTCSLLKNKVACWGANDQKQSDPRSDDKFKPAMNELDFGVTGNLSMLTLAGNASCVVAAGVAGAKSRAFCFGSGELGRADPGAGIAVVDGIEDVRRLALSNKHGCAIASAKGSTEIGLYCWGSNDAKAVDPNATEARFPTPHRVLFPPQ